MTRRRRPVLGLLTLVVVCLIAFGVLVHQRDSDPREPGPDVAARLAGEQFLDDYVDPDGRVVRRDESGDTVSEGQAYALLVAVAIGDRERFRSVWNWTREHLQRPDSLLSWRWADGAVVDPSSAADADLDAARALVLAGQRFADPAMTTAGRMLAGAVLAGETVRVGTTVAGVAAATLPDGSAISGEGIVLTAGNWSTTTPATVNPSYFSPRADRVLGEASDDPRWDLLSQTQRAVSWQLIGTGNLPADWVRVDAVGTATPTPTDTAGNTQYGMDAARFPIRMAESCDPADRALAAALDGRIGDGEGAGTVAVFGLDGTARVDWAHPLALVGAAGAAAAAGDAERAGLRLDEASDLLEREPSYYGSAWVALGRIMLETTMLGDCAG